VQLMKIAVIATIVNFALSLIILDNLFIFFLIFK